VEWLLYEAHANRGILSAAPTNINKHSSPERAQARPADC